MTGPEHYREAEQHLRWAIESEQDGNGERFNLAVAQVHATLAVAAATVGLDDGDIWAAVIR